jgi:hypothetical protein
VAQRFTAAINAAVSIPALEVAEKLAVALAFGWRSASALR